MFTVLLGFVAASKKVRMSFNSEIEVDAFFIYFYFSCLISIIEGDFKWL